MYKKEMRMEGGWYIVCPKGKCIASVRWIEEANRLIKLLNRE